jgi:hypothetical protein
MPEACQYHQCIDNTNGVCSIPGMTRRKCRDEYLYPVRVREEFSIDGYEERRQQNGTT